MVVLRFLLFLIVLSVFIAVFARAEQAESLQGLGTLVAEETTAVDTSFAQRLENEGLIDDAILEWRRVAFNAGSNATREQALWKVAELLQQSGNSQKAYEGYATFAQRFPNSTQLPKALYHMGLLKLQTFDFATAAQALSRLEADFTNSPWHTGLEYAYFWRYAYTNGQPLEVSSSLNPQLVELNSRLHAELKKQQTATAPEPTHAAALAAIPAYGLFSVDFWLVGVLAVIFFALVLWAGIYAARQRHWPYAALLLSCASLGYCMSYMLNYLMIAENTPAVESFTLQDVMNTWPHLYPTDPETGQPVFSTWRSSDYID